MHAASFRPHAAQRGLLVADAVCLAEVVSALIKWPLLSPPARLTVYADAQLARCAPNELVASSDVVDVC